MPVITPEQISSTTSLLSVNPAWSMVVLATIALFLGGLIFLGWQLIRNTKITDGIANHLAAKTADGAVERIAATVEEIRQGQIVSNTERKSQALDISQLKQDVTENKYDTLCLSREVHRIRIAMRLPSTPAQDDAV
jgi:hypothetical protein